MEGGGDVSTSGWEAFLSSAGASHLCRVSPGNLSLPPPTAQEWTLRAYIWKGLYLRAHRPEKCSFRVLGHYGDRLQTQMWLSSLPGPRLLKCCRYWGGAETATGLRWLPSRARKAGKAIYQAPHLFLHPTYPRGPGASGCAAGMSTLFYSIKSFQESRVD